MSAREPHLELSEELRQLVQAVGVPLVEVTPLHGSGYAGYQHTSFRLRLADGRLLKGRQCGNWQRAAAIEYVFRHVHHPNLPKLLARTGRAVLTEWVEGRPMAAGDCSATRLRECGALLGFVHSVPVPQDHPYQRRTTVAEWQSEYESDLAALERIGALESGEARRARAHAVEHAPGACGLSFVHRDFCAENMVLRPSGVVAVVDNETVDIDTCENDLGRTWYRWPMTREQRDAFLAGYECHRSAAQFVRHESYWLLVATASSAVFRWQKSPAAAEAPLARLRALLLELDGRVPQAQGPSRAPRSPRLGSGT